MYKKIVLFILVVCAVAFPLQAQKNKSSKPTGRIAGAVFDEKSGEAIAFANVALLRTKDSALVKGDISIDDGSFVVSAPFGTYILRISNIGYKTYFHSNTLTLSANNKDIKLGKIKIKPEAKMMDEVVITAERSMVEYQLDKRVVNVEKNIVASGGTATDVLENVPSVSIDNDGNVSLRGSSNVKVLIDGRPYELLGSDLDVLLEQIPATSIENVEVITNPSAKYDPEGMSGIINIKLKERNTTALGLNGIANLNVGAPMPFLIPDGMDKFIPTAMGSLNLNYTTEKYNLFFNLDGGTRARAHAGESFVRRRSGGSTISEDSLFSQNLHRSYMFNVKLGGEYYFNPKNSLLLSYQLRRGQFGRNNHTDNIDVMNNGLYDYIQYDSNTTQMYNHTFNLNYRHKFDRKDQELTFNATYGHRNRNANAGQEQIYDIAASNWARYYWMDNHSNNSGDNVDLQLNYTQPIGEKMKFEAGYNGQMQWSSQNYDYFRSTYNASQDLVRARDNNSSMHYDFGQQIHAIFATFGATFWEHFSAQAGLRAEYSNIKGVDRDHASAQEIDKDYYTLYPTLHASYQITQDQSVQLSYSRRVNRPRMRSLHPYLNIREGMELSFGNPGIDPEFTDAIELAYNIGFKKTNIFTSAYFRQTNNMMTRYGFEWTNDNVLLYSPWMAYNSEYDGYWASTWMNLDKGYNYGLECIVDQGILPWWKVNVSVNLYESRIEGTEILDNQDRDFFRVNGKLSSLMNLPSGWTIQFSGQYQSPFHDLQSDMNAHYWFDLAVKKDVLHKQGTINLRISDIFMTGRFGGTTDTPQMYRTWYSRRISPAVSIGFSYKINNGLRQRPNRPGADDDEGGDDE